MPESEYNHKTDSDSRKTGMVTIPSGHHCRVEKSLKQTPNFADTFLMFGLVWIIARSNEASTLQALCVW